MSRRNTNPENLTDQELRAIADAAPDEIRRRRARRREREAESRRAEQRARDYDRVSELCDDCLRRLRSFFDTNRSEQRKKIRKAAIDCCGRLPTDVSDPAALASEVRSARAMERVQSRMREPDDGRERPVRAEQIDLPVVGPIDRRVALGAAAIGAVVLFASASSSSSSTNATPRSGEERQEFMSRCLSDTGGDMSLCAEKWRKSTD